MSILKNFAKKKDSSDNFGLPDVTVSASTLELKKSRNSNLSSV